MLKMLKSLCIFLKVLMLTKVAIVSSLEDLEDHEILNISDINNHYMLPKNEFVEHSKLAIKRISTTENVPSEPTFPRIFVEFDKNINERNNISVTFRWKQPAFTGKEIKKYTVEYGFIENATNEMNTTIVIIPATKLQLEVHDLRPNTMYYFKVRAHNEIGVSNYTEIINVSTTHENPVPRLLIGSWSGIKIFDIDLQKVSHIFKELRAIEFTYSTLERKIYWINDKSQLMTTDLTIETKQKYTKIIDLDDSAHNLCIDWIARNLYWIQINHSNNQSSIMKLDLTLLQIDMIKYDIILNTNGSKLLSVLPSKGYIYWMGLNSDNKYVLMHSNVNEKNIKPFLQSRKLYDTNCPCQYELLEPSSMQIDNINIDNPLIYWISKGSLIATDIHGCKCNLILSAGNNEKLIDSLTIDETNIYLYSQYKQEIYILQKKDAKLDSKTIGFENVQNIMFYTNDLHHIKAVGNSLQRYPSKICQMPKMSDERYHVEVMNITANSIVVRLPEPVLNDKCENYNLATTIYTISVGHRWNKDRSELKKFQTHERYYEIQNLSPSTEYIVKLALSNFYFDFYKLPIHFDRGVILTTTSEELNAENVVILMQYIPGVIGTLVCGVCIYYSQCKRSRNVQPSSTSPPPPVELIPIDTSNNNIEYITVTALKKELQGNPNIQKIKIEEILSRDEFLGEGTFRIVNQGMVRNLEGLQTMCAIKKLPGNATLLQERKFLQEAKKMSRFDHKNVLKLFGICWYADSPMLILELMETDLLTYLRENQTLNPLSAQSLRLQDLLAMCEDVARGCHYLEEMRYVHRDLACRNCLISTRNDGSRIVKISNFYLCNDIYMDNHYIDLKI
ncbi:proto-oncogene tyrosine-protein kinase ROS-like isoform X2 [Nylanderia fulva]|uniref:proto-oncogene tyrosine-protein kinase ROS-like isoform X2 n=1 Tax=Nylanderia fulva TaxID=613905 RepID=UPI0010FAD552|nr:proto-oncogene tyrosine-protein kinase ROS-like isoform X2 [Nylanderia fulva]